MHDVEHHYTHGGLERSIFQALESAGKDVRRLTLNDLAPIDEFHIRGREATKELADEIGLRAGVSVLDVGCGLGGPSRRLAADYGCRVIGLDLTQEYCDVATSLSARLGLDDLVSYRHGNALEMPFEDMSFDVVWTQHASMNIRDKARYYGEMYRVLRPGGHLAIHDILAGTGGQVHFPVPWAREPSISFLASEEELRRFLEDAGFHILSWRDTTERARAWFEAMTERVRSEGRPALGYHVLLGDDFDVMAQNQVRNLIEKRIALMQIVGQRATA